MANLNRVAMLLLAVLLSQCGVNRPVVLNAGNTASPPPVQQPQGNGPSTQPVFLEGEFRDTNGNVIQLEDFKSKPTVLIFASEFCEVCLRETRSIVEKLDNKRPTGVNIITVLVGLDQPQWAEDWATDHQVPWLVGIDSPNLALKNKYCGASPVPCNVVQTPEDGIVLQKVGEAHIEELEKLTGPWETL